MIELEICRCRQLLFSQPIVEQEKRNCSAIQQYYFTCTFYILHSRFYILHFTFHIIISPPFSVIASSLHCDNAAIGDPYPPVIYLSNTVLHWRIFIAMELRISEYDQAGKDVAVYVSSKGSDRIEFIVCQVHSLPIYCPRVSGSPPIAYNLKRTEEQGILWTRLLSVFLPAGYPHSVTSDYMWYVLFYLVGFGAVESQASCQNTPFCSCKFLSFASIVYNEIVDVSFVISHFSRN